MNDRTYVEKAAYAGAGKVSLLQLDPSRYLLRSVGAGMVLTLVGFVFWVLTQNLSDISLGRVIAAGFFGVGLTIIVFTNTELFTSNNMYLTVSSAERRTSWNKRCCCGPPAILEISPARSWWQRCSWVQAPFSCLPIMRCSRAPCTRPIRPEA
jgi:Formate/nitrite transporter